MKKAFLISILSIAALVGAQTKLSQTQVITSTIVIGEVPVYNSTANTFSLQHTPTGLACYQNGVRQMINVDFTFSGGTITSPYWQSTDLLQCDYRY